MRAHRTYASTLSLSGYSPSSRVMFTARLGGRSLSKPDEGSDERRSQGHRLPEPGAQAGADRDQSVLPAREDVPAPGTEASVRVRVQGIDRRDEARRRSG